MAESTNHNSVPMYDEAMNPVMVHPADVQNNLQAGYTIPTPEEVQDYKNEQKYGGVGQQLKAGAEGAASAATFGTSTGLEIASGIAKPEDIQGRREANPISHGIGQVGGLALPSLIPGVGELAAGTALERAGAAGAKALIPGAEGVLESSQAVRQATAGLNLAKKSGQGIEEAQALLQAAKQSRQAQPYIAKVGTEAANQAIQMGLFQSGDEVSKMFSGAPGYEDPGTATQTALTNIGLSSILGGGTGAVFGSVSPLWQATSGKKLEGLGDAIVNRANGESVPLANNIDHALTQVNAAPEVKSLLSENPAIRMKGMELAEAGTPASDVFVQAKDQVVSDLKNQIKDIFQPQGEVSAIDAAKTAKEAFLDEEKRLDAIVENAYKTSNPYAEKTIVPEESRLKLHEKLMEASENMGEKGADAPHKSIFKSYADALLEQPTVADQNQLLSRLGGEQKAALNPLTPNFVKADALGEIKSIVREFQEQLLPPEGVAVVKAANKSYTDYMKATTKIADIAGLGKKKMTSGIFTKAIEDAPAIKFAENLFDPKYIEDMKYLQEFHPKAFESAANLYKSDMARSSMKGTDFQHSQLLTKYQKGLRPEVRNMLFSPEQQKTIEGSIDAIRLAGERINPSGTAKGMAKIFQHMPASVIAMVSWLSHTNPLAGYLMGKIGDYLGRQAPDAVKLSLLKFLGSNGPVDAGAWKVAADFINHAYKGQRLIETAAENVFKSSPKFIAIPEGKHLESLDKKLRKIQEDPLAHLKDIGGPLVQYLPNHATDLARTAASASTYLNGLRPDLTQKNPLDSKPEASAEQKAIFQRALQIAESPLTVLEDVRKGTITPKDIMHLNALYPQLYGTLKQQLMNQMINTVHKEEPIPYKTRFGVSMFLGQPLDSTMTPQAIQALNPPPMPQQGQSPQGPSHGPRHSSMKNINKIGQGYMTASQSREAKRVQD